MKATRQPAMLFIFITLLIDVIGLGIIIPVFPKLIAGMVGGNMSDASLYGGWLISAYALMQFLFSPLLGNLSDQYGRRPILLLSLLGLGLDYLLLAFAPSIEWFFVGRIISGIMGASFTTASAYIADISTPEKRAANFGLIGAAFGLGFIIGPSLGGVLGYHMGTQAPFIAAAILSLLNLIYGYFVLPESLAPENRRPFNWKRANPLGSLKQLTKYPVMAGMVVSFLLIYIASHAIQSTWNFFTFEVMQWNESQVGWSLGFVGVMVALVQGLLIRVITPKIGVKRSVYLGLLLYAFGLLLFSFATEGWMMYAILIPYCLGGIAGPALQSIISAHVPSNEQGELQGGLTSLISVTSVVGPLMMTRLFYMFTDNASPIYFPGAAFLAGSLLTFLSLVLTYRFLRHHKA
jgi:MFS transporter, DHA1 family, tetracycline resistance protein